MLSLSINTTRECMRWWGPRVCFCLFFFKPFIPLLMELYSLNLVQTVPCVFLSPFGLAFHMNEGYKVISLLLFFFFSFYSCVKEIRGSGLEFGCIISYIFVVVLFKRFGCRLIINFFFFSCILLNIWHVLNTRVIYELGFVLRLYFSSMM